MGWSNLNSMLFQRRDAEIALSYRYFYLVFAG